jgi:prepilin-type N-terminal cleavage/methylation domain-containing protein
MLEPMMRRWRGFTLIELMMVVAVVALLVTLAAPSFYNFILVQRLKSITAQIETDLQFARSEAAARNLAVQVRFSSNSSTSCYALFTGREGFCDCTNPPSNPVCPAATETEIRTVQVPRSLGVQVAPGTPSDEFGFDPSTGGMRIFASDTPIAPGTPFLINSYIDSDRTLRVVVKVSGRPGTCAPTNSTVTGVAAC